MPTATSTKVKREITLPEDLYDRYAERAAKAGVGVESEIVKRLTRCVDHTAVTPLYLTDEQRNRLNIVAGKLIESPEDLINWALRLSRLKVQGVEITLDERVLSRIDGRRFGATLADTIRKFVIEGLQEKVGMR